MKKDVYKKKLFLPMITAVVITILIYLFSLIFIEDFRQAVNYVFICLIYVYLYVILFMLFNNLHNKFVYIFIDVWKFISRYFKIHNYSAVYDKNKIASLKNESKYLKLVFLFVNLGIVLFFVFIWQLVIGVQFKYWTCLLCLFVFIVLLIVIPSILIVCINRSKAKKNKSKKNKNKKVIN